jgi:hypothetical protein
MEDRFSEGLLALERQAFVKYVTVADKNGYSIAGSGDATKRTAAYVREVENCIQALLPGAQDVTIVVEGSQKSVVIGQKGDFLVGVQVVKEMF